MTGAQKLWRILGESDFYKVVGRRWSAAVRGNPRFAVCESITRRRIPVVVLTPAN